MVCNPCPVLIRSILAWIFGITGFFTMVLVLLSFTDLPYHAYHRLGTVNAGMESEPDVIVLLGGSGMPSPDGLMRCFFAAGAAKAFPDAPVIIAHSSAEDDSLSQLKLMAQELILRGTDPARIRFEPEGFSTHTQALNIAEMFGTAKDTLSLMLVTSPEHMYRSVKSFRKAGFREVGGSPAFEQPIGEESAADSGKDDGLRVKSLSLRYNMWNYLRYELLVLREYAAIAYYRIKGWI